MSLTETNYKLVGTKKNEIVDFETEEHGLTEEKLVRVFEVLVKLQGTWAQYSIKHEVVENDKTVSFDRCANFFYSDGIDLKAIAPDTGGQLNEWHFDANVSIDLNDFSLTCNLVTQKIFIINAI